MPELTSQMIATIGIFLTLTGLLGTFFYVHLSNWVRDLLTLETKWNVYHLSSTEEATKAQRECRYTLPSLHNNLPLLMAASVSIFVLLMEIMGIIILAPLFAAIMLATFLLFALIVFAVIYVLLVIYLLRRGYGIGGRLKTAIDKKFPAAAPAPAVKPAGRP